MTKNDPTFTKKEELSRKHCPKMPKTKGKATGFTKKANHLQVKKVSESLA